LKCGNKKRDRPLIQKIKRITLNYKVPNEAKNQSLSNPTRRVGLGVIFIL